MVWLVTHMWMALAGAAILGLFFGSSIRGMMLRGRARTAVVERDIAHTELEQARAEIDGLYQAQRKLQASISEDAPELAAEPDPALQQELDSRGQRISEMNAELADAKASLEALKAEAEAARATAAAAEESAAAIAAAESAAAAHEPSESSNIGQAVQTGLAAVAGAAAGAATAGALDDGLDKEKTELVMRNRFLESRVRDLETKITEIAAVPAEGLAAAPVAAPVEATGISETDAKLRWQNEYLRQRVAALEETTVSAGTAVPVSAPAPLPSDTSAGAAAGSTESTDEELARLRWRNRYLEGRIAYLDGDGTGDAGEGAAAPAHDPSVNPADAILEQLAVEDVDRVEPARLASARDGKGDDLTAIGGIGPKIQDVLNTELGIYHYNQVASWTPENVAWVEDHLGFSGRIRREGWVDQAKSLSEPVS